MTSHPYIYFWNRMGESDRSISSVETAMTWVGDIVGMESAA
jgi:hypothetical protein